MWFVSIPILVDIRRNQTTATVHYTHDANINLDEYQMHVCLRSEARVSYYVYEV